MRRLVLLLLAAPAGVPAQDLAARDAMLMEGSFVRDVRGDDCSLVAVIAQQIYNEFRAAKKVLPPKADAVVEPLRQAVAQKNTNLAWRLGTRFIAFARNDPWGDGQEAAASLDLRLDRRIAAPGDVIHARLVPLYTLGRALHKPLTAEIGFAQRAPRQLTVENLADMEVPLATTGFTPGVYHVRYRLLEDAQPLVDLQREVTLDASIAPRVAALRKRQHALPESATVDYILDTIERATHSYVGSLDELLYPMAESLRDKKQPPYSGPLFHLERDLAQAEQFLDALEHGRSTLAGAHGDFRMAFRSLTDKSLHPYRLFLPPPREGVKSWPLIIALHDASGDENSYIESLHIDKLAAERGYAVACPAARGTARIYRDHVDKDVLDLLDLLLAKLPIDKNAVFLTGHSTGSNATLQIGTRFAGRFAALAAVAGVPAAESMDLDAGGKVRLRLYQGAKDDVMLPEAARSFALVAKYRFQDFAYIEHKDDDYFTIPRTTLPEIFDFFDSVRRAAAKP